MIEKLVLFFTMILALSAHAEDFLRGKALDQKAKITKIAFGSCFNQDAPAPIWSTILKSNPDLYLGLGDNVYASDPSQRPIWDQYLKIKKHPDLKELFETIPFLTTWDDHDFGLNDGGKENPYFEEAKNAYLAAFQVDSLLISANQRGIEHSVILGEERQRIQLIFLDTRSYRDPWKKQLIPLPGLGRYEPNEDPSKNLLGEAQWKWLESQLDQPAEVRILVSSIQFLAEGHGYERWGLMPHEQKKLENLIILSGDRHLGEIFRKKIDSDVQIIEVTSSGLNKASSIIHENEPLRVGQLHSVIHFGFLIIDWPKKEVTASLRDQEGAVLEQITLSGF